MNTTTPAPWRTVILGLVIAGILLLALAGYLNPLLRGTLTPIVAAQGWLSSRYTALVEFLTVPRDVASLREQNARLEAELARLQARVIELEQEARESDVLYSLLGFAQKRPENRYVAAAVVGRDPNPFMRYIIIDHGSDDGLRRGMPVVTEQGLVGRITNVSSVAALVQLVTDPGSAVNVQLQESETEAILNGSITGDLSLDMIPQDVQIQPGELVLTSGLGGTYPANLVVGQVLSVRHQENDLFQGAAIQPVVDFNSLQAVLVITSFQPVDISPLVPEGQVP